MDGPDGYEEGGGLLRWLLLLVLTVVLCVMVHGCDETTVAVETSAVEAAPPAIPPGAWLCPLIGHDWQMVLKSGYNSAQTDGYWCGRCFATARVKS